ILRRWAQGKIPRGWPALPGAVSAARRDRRLSPEVLKPIRRKFGVTHRVLDVLVHLSLILRRWAQANIPRGRPAWPGAVGGARRDRRLSPEVLKPIRRKFGVTHRVLDVLVPQSSL